MRLGLDENEKIDEIEPLESSEPMNPSGSGGGAPIDLIGRWRCACADIMEADAMIIAG